MRKSTKRIWLADGDLIMGVKINYDYLYRKKIERVFEK